AGHDRGRKSWMSAPRGPGRWGALVLALARGMRSPSLAARGLTPEQARFTRRGPRARIRPRLKSGGRERSGASDPVRGQVVVLVRCVGAREIQELTELLLEGDDGAEVDGLRSGGLPPRGAPLDLERVVPRDLPRPADALEHPDDAHRAALEVRHAGDL